MKTRSPISRCRVPILTQQASLAVVIVVVAACVKVVVEMVAVVVVVGAVVAVVGVVVVVVVNEVVVVGAVIVVGVVVVVVAVVVVVVVMTVLHKLVPQQAGPLVMVPTSCMKGSVLRTVAAAHRFKDAQPKAGEVTDPFVTKDETQL